MPIMAIAVLLTMMGSAWSVFFSEGSALAKNLEKRAWVAAVDDHAVAATMDAALFGEEPPTEEISTHDPETRIELIRGIDRVAIVLCALIAAALPFLTRWKRQSAWLYALPALWLLINAYAVASNGGKAHAEWSIPAHATRWMLPIALALLIATSQKAKPATNWLLRLSCASAFAVHGWEAFQLNPPFQDLIFVSTGLIGLPASPEVCHLLLRGIGIMDVLLALSVIFVHHRKTLYWMTFWGLLTAISRPLTMGLDAWPELAIRLANGAVPWLILWLGAPALIPSKKRDESFHNPSTVVHDT